MTFFCSHFFSVATNSVCWRKITCFIIFVLMPLFQFQLLNYVQSVLGIKHWVVIYALPCSVNMLKGIKSRVEQEVAHDAMRCIYFTAWHGFSLVEGISTLFPSYLARQFAVDLHLSSTWPNLTPFLCNPIFRFKTLAAVLWRILPFTLEGDRWWVARTFDSGPLQQELHWPSCKPLSYFLSCPLDQSLVLL